MSEEVVRVPAVTGLGLKMLAVRAQLGTKGAVALDDPPPHSLAPRIAKLNAIQRDDVRSYGVTNLALFEVPSAIHIF